MDGVPDKFIDGKGDAGMLLVVSTDGLTDSMGRTADMLATGSIWDVTGIIVV